MIRPLPLDRWPTPTDDPGPAAGDPPDSMPGVARCPGLMGVFAHAPAAFAALEAWSTAQLASVLPKTTREAVLLRVADLHDCGHARRLQVAELARLGVDGRTIGRAENGLSDDCHEQALLAFATKLVVDRGHHMALAVHSARQIGVSDEELVEVLALVGLGTLASYVCHLSTLDDPPGSACETP